MEIKGKLVQIDETQYAIPITILTGNVVQQCGERFVFENIRATSPLPLDYNHNDDEIVGRVDEVKDVGSGEVSGVAVFVARADLPSARVNEILTNLKAGVPYEVSPFIDLADAVPEEVPEGSTAEINGRAESGPFTIWRGATMRGVAICPHGADGGTAFVALSYKEGKKMEEEKVERQVDPELLELIEEFGKERGVDYYLEGFTLEEARADDYAQLKALAEEKPEEDEEKKEEKDAIAELSARFDKLERYLMLRRGDATGVSASPERRPEPEKKPALWRAAEKFRRAGVVRPE